jgi:hypothetical protein
MKRNRILAILGTLVMVALACSLMFGCSTTACLNGQRAFDSAQAAYDKAAASGNTKQIDQYWWALEATRAAVAMWCSTQSETPAVAK